MSAVPVAQAGFGRTPATAIRNDAHSHALLTLRSFMRLMYTKDRPLVTLSAAIPDGYDGMMPIARAATTITVISETRLCKIISAFAREESGIASVGLNAVAVVNPKKR